MRVDYEQVQAATARIAGGVARTPCVESVPLSRLTGCRVFCKLDHLQRTGSFKERGALNALLQLDDARTKRGVTAASAGNHALGLAYHGQRLGIPVTVVMPRFAPLIKVRTCRQFGAEVVLEGQSFDEARALADRFVEERGLTYVHGYDDPAIIAGQGTVAVEIAEQVDRFDAVIVPVGGGGLIAGIAEAMNNLKPEAQIIGVEPATMACFAEALKAGKPVDVAPHPTLADGLAISRVGSNAFETARPHVEQVVTVDEDALALAVLRMAELEKAVVEGAAAAPLAALCGGRLDDLQGKTVVLVVAGGNIDPAVLGHVIEKGLVADGRLCRFRAIISDRPGGLAALTKAIAEVGASVEQVVHDRPFTSGDIAHVCVDVTVETHDHTHMQQLRDALEAGGIRVVKD